MTADPDAGLILDLDEQDATVNATLETVTGETGILLQVTEGEDAAHAFLTPTRARSLILRLYELVSQAEAARYAQDMTSSGS